jgi:hypothetical protein
MRDDDMQGPKDTVSQIVDGDKNQVAGRDIINHHVENARPKRLDEHTPDELRRQRVWSRQLIKDAKNKIRMSWPVTLMKYTVPLFIIGTVVFFELKWLNLFVIAGMLSVGLPYALRLKVNEAEYNLIQSQSKIIEYIYGRLREFGIDER